MSENFLTSRFLGGIGCVLCALAITSHFGIIIALMGFIFLLISLNMFSKIFKDQRIFKNALISVILSLISAGLLVFTIGLIGFSIISLSYPFYYLHFFKHIWTLSFMGFLAIYVLLIISAYYLKTAFEILSFYTEITLFKIGGTCYFIGNILIIIFIGVWIIFASWIILAIGFFIMPDEKKKKILEQNRLFV